MNVAIGFQHCQTMDTCYCGQTQQFDYERLGQNVPAPTMTMSMHSMSGDLDISLEILCTIGCDVVAKKRWMEKDGDVRTKLDDGCTSR